MRGMVFDLETTGLYDPIDIIQLSYLIFDVDSGHPIGQGRERFFLPCRVEIDPNAYCASGISEEFLFTVTDSTFKDFVPEFTEILKNVDILIGHNISGYDLRVLHSYNDNTLNNLLDNKQVIDTMKDFMHILFKLTCLKKSTEITKSYLKLAECYYFLLRNGYTQTMVEEGFKQIFPNVDGHFHNASFDVYITYLTYLFVRGDVSNVKTVS